VHFRGVACSISPVRGHMQTVLRLAPEFSTVDAVPKPSSPSQATSSTEQTLQRSEFNTGTRLNRNLLEEARSTSRVGHTPSHSSELKGDRRSSLPCAASLATFSTIRISLESREVVVSSNPTCPYVLQVLSSSTYCYADRAYLPTYIP